MKVAVVGLGYVGWPLASWCDHKGMDVVGIDNNINRVNDLAGKVGLVTNDYSEIEGSDIVCVCVPTPVYENHKPDLEYVVSACDGVGAYLDNNQVVVIESTVNPGVCRDTALPHLQTSGYVEGQDFYLAHCPERINPGDLEWHVGNIPRVVGAMSEEGLRRATDFYRSLIDGEIRAMNTIDEAEAVKIMENAFRDVNIAFVNELAMIYGKLGIDITEVIKGASTKPFGFKAHWPGCGVGGHCIPVDPYYLIDQAEREGLDPGFLSWARKVNEGMPGYTVQLLEEELNAARLPINGTSIALLGISYKPGISDMRESPALEIQKKLIERKANLKIFDPYVPELSNVRSIEEALRGTDAVVLATAHSEFNDLAVSGLKVVIDGRNVLDKKAVLDQGVRYRGIGR
jgi:UDP-N-acetyl-D-glucosamine dehydrogenase